MKGELLKRLFREIASEDQTAVESMLSIVVEEERKKGHAILAGQLENITNKSSRQSPQLSPDISRDLMYKAHSSAIYQKHDVQSLTLLSSNQRFNHPFIVTTPRERLRHHMILSSVVENRFRRIEKEYVARERLAHHGLRYRQKILLYGTPGCGKTMGAERLAWNTGLKLKKSC